MHKHFINKVRIKSFLLWIFLFLQTFAFAQEKNLITGTVQDQSGNPIANATVKLGTHSNPNEGPKTKTNEKGIFEIKNTSSDQALTVTVTAIGYKSQSVNLSAKNAKNSVLIQMDDATSDLDQVVVIGYGKSSKRKITSSVSTLDMKNVAPIPVASINDAIAGRVQGVIVTSSTGAPGAKSTVSIRGGGTPLYVIDGFIRTANDFSNINPNDIESYSILKDASATSVYGALGGNGVILVTTKKGSEGQLNINYSYNQIFTQPTTLPNRLSSFDKLSSLKKVYQSEGSSGFNISDADLQKYKDGSDPYNFPNTNWQKLFMKTYAPESRHDFSISQGTKTSTYYASISNYHQGTILKTPNNSNNRLTYRLNTESKFADLNLKLNTGIDGYFEDNLLPASNNATTYDQIFGHIQQQSSTAMPYNDLGLPFSGNGGDNAAMELSPLSGYNKTQVKVFNAIMGLDYETHFLKNLHIKLNGNYNSKNTNNKLWNTTAPTYDLKSNSPIIRTPTSLSASSAQEQSLLLQGFLDYKIDLKDHHVELSTGYEQYKYQTSSLGGIRKQFVILYDQFLAGPTANQEVYGGEGESARAGFISRLNYNYKDKYTLEGTLRRDGNDLLPKGKQWGTFYALAAGWTLSEENFMKSLKEKHILDFFKIRGSMGLTGTLQNIFTGDPIAPFQYVSGYSVNSNVRVIGDQLVQGTSEPGSLPSNNFSWYNITNRNFGVDLATLNNKLSATIDYFYMRTTGFVINNTKYAATLGIGLPPINFKEGATRREGTEFNVTWNDRASFGLNYKLGLNFTYYNTLTERQPGELEAALKNPYTRNSGTGNDYLTTGYHSLGYYQSNQELLNGARRINSINTSAGDLKYLDVNGDGQIDGNDARRIGSNSMPRINYGFNFDLDYKGFFLTGTVFGSGNRDRYLGNTIQGGSIQGTLIYDFQKDYWRPDNRNGIYPRQVSTPGINGGNNYETSDFWIMKSQFIRLKYLQFGYNFNSKLLNSIKIKNLKVFVSGTNLFTSAKSLNFYIDPESNPDNIGYPIQRTISFGVNVGF